MALARHVQSLNVLCLMRSTTRKLCSSIEEGKTVQTITGERSVNKLTILGRLGNDPEVRGSIERPVTTFSVATSITVRSGEDEYRQLTEWHRVSVLRDKLQQWCAATLRKGDRVFVTGPMRYGKYIDKNTDNVIRTANLNADDVILLSRRKERSLEENLDE